MAGRVTGSTVVVSTIGVALRQRGIGVGELQRRLAERGIRVSRGALDRLAWDRPLKAINFELLLPILEELGITLGEPFVALPNDELERQQAARALGREAARNLANGDATSSAVAALVDDADLADDDSIDRAFAAVAAAGGIDIMVHSIAYAPQETFTDRFVNTSREAFRVAGFERHKRSSPSPPPASSATPP